MQEIIWTNVSAAVQHCHYLLTTANFNTMRIKRQTPAIHMIRGLSGASDGAYNTQTANLATEEDFVY